MDSASAMIQRFGRSAGPCHTIAIIVRWQAVRAGAHTLMIWAVFVDCTNSSHESTESHEDVRPALAS